MIKILQHDADKNVLQKLTLYSRDWTVHCLIANDTLIMSADYAGDIFGTPCTVIFEESDIKALHTATGKFFEERAQSKLSFNANTPPVTPEGIPELTISYTNWGEPYEEGVQFVFTQNRDEPEEDEIYFSLTSSDFKALFNVLKTYVEQTHAQPSN